MSLPRIAVDAMGGDEGVRVMVEGAALARRRHDKFQFLLVGDEMRIKAALDTHPGMAGASEILHCTDVVGGDEPPSRAQQRVDARERDADGRVPGSVGGGNAPQVGDVRDEGTSAAHGGSAQRLLDSGARAVTQLPELRRAG